MRSLLILSLASTALSHSLLHKRHGPIKARRIEERAVEALNIDAAAIFPPPPLLEKRGLLGGLLGGVGDIVNTIVAPLLPSTTTTAAAAPTTTTAAAATTSNAQGDTQAPATPTPSDTPAVPVASPTSSAGAGNTNPSNGNTPAAGSGSASSGATGGTKSAVDLHAVPTAQVVTDHFGNSLTITAPVTRTWVTTFPNGVVSTMTEVISPTVEVPGSAPTPMAPAKIAAIVGIIVTVFLVTFAVTLALLMMRKRQKKRIALLDSRRNSVSSFGSASDEFNDERRLSHAPIAPNASVMTFVTAPAYIGGATLDFPLPPVPAANSRPGSSQSDSSYDFSQYRKSRASIIEDRNRFRKIGQYPDADSYTPFVLPPSEFTHSEEATGVSVIGHDPSLESSSSASYHTSNNVLLVAGENPFTDPVTVPQPTHMPISNTNPLTNGAARRSTLWRTATFGPNSRHLSRVASIGRDTIGSEESSEYETALEYRVADGTDSNTPPSRHPSTSTGRFSYHSAFEAYIRADSPQASENPFVDQPLPAVPGSMSPQGVAYPALRPGTSSGGTSVVSSAGSGNRTPDPADLFFRNSTDHGQAPGTRVSGESPPPRDSESTVRGTSIAYPALRDATSRGNSP